MATARTPFDSARGKAVGEMRQKIVAAARGCVARKGVHATTMRDIAHEAGMSLSTMYRHFDGKSEVMRCLADGLARSDAAAAKEISHELTGRNATPQQLWELLRSSPGGWARAEDRLRAELWAEASRAPEIAEILGGGADLVRHSFQNPDNDHHAPLLTAAFYGAHMLRSLTENAPARRSVSHAAYSDNQNEEPRGK